MLYKHIGTNYVGVVYVVAFSVIAAVVLGFVFKPSSTSAPKVEEKKREKVEGPFTKEEVAKHNTSSDAWLIIDGKVYDVTDYIDSHPGGDAILNNVGQDSSKGFHGPQHPVSVWDVLANYYIGDLVNS
jgi:cytochrome b involved in lipid metabolism